MSSKYYIVTGGTSGIGLEAAKELAAAKPDDRVIITGRSRPQVELPPNVELHLFDLGSIAEINTFVAGWEHPVSALLLNAGLVTASETQFIDGVERAFAVNHLGGAALFFALHAKGLLTDDARIIPTSSAMHDTEMVGNPAKPQWTSAAAVAGAADAACRNPSVQYSNTKLANVLWAYALSRHAEEKGTGWTVAVFDPAFAPGGGSRIGREGGALNTLMFEAMSYVPSLVTWMTGIVTSTIPRSGKALAHLAIDEAHTNEKMAYYQLEYKMESSKQSHDVALQDDLWDWTVQKLGVQTDL